MKRTYLIILLLVTLLTPLAAAEVVLQPDGDQGKDAQVTGYYWDDALGNTEELLLDYEG